MLFGAFYIKQKLDTTEKNRSMYILLFEINMNLNM